LNGEASVVGARSGAEEVSGRLLAVEVSRVSWINGVYIIAMITSTGEFSWHLMHEKGFIFLLLEGVTYRAVVLCVTLEASATCGQ
jgi:hypothetical protein